MFKTKYTFDHKKRYEVLSDELLTAQDESFTIKEILDKFTSGQPLPIAHTPHYDDDPDYDNIDPQLLDLDISEVYQLLNDTKQNLSDLEQRKQELLAQQEQQEKERLEKPNQQSSQNKDETASE